jgi:hypothetical protein
MELTVRRHLSCHLDDCCTREDLLAVLALRGRHAANTSPRLWKREEKRREEKKKGVGTESV